MYQHMNALNVYSIKNLHSALRACQVCTSTCACECLSGMGSPHHLLSLRLQGGRRRHRCGRETATGHVGAPTSRQCYVNSLMHCDEVRLPNPWKTKVPSVKPDKTSTTAALAAWEIFSPGGQAAAHLWDIDDGKTPGFYRTAANGF